MKNKILKNWDNQPKESFIKKIEEKIHGSPPLKEKIAHVTWRLKLQHEKLENASAKLQKHDRELFDKCVQAELAKDHTRAAIYANECAEVRKMAKIILLSQLAIEKVILRLQTIQEFGDVLQGLAPVTGVIRTLKGNLSGIIPEVSYELDSISEMLNGMMVEAGKTSDITFTVEAEGEESRKILKEAGAVAEQRLKERFPEIPATLTEKLSQKQ